MNISYNGNTLSMDNNDIVEGIRFAIDTKKCRIRLKGTGIHETINGKNIDILISFDGAKIKFNNILLKFGIYNCNTKGSACIESTINVVSMKPVSTTINGRNCTLDSIISFMS